MLRFACSGKILGLALIALAAAPEAAGAGAWTKPKGDGEVIVTGLYSEALEAFNGNGDPAAIPVLGKFEIAAHAEYGLTDWLTAIGRTELKTVAAGETVAVDEARFGLTGLGARVRLWEGQGAVVSAEAIGRIALGGGDHAEDGDADLRLLAGYGFALGTWSGFIDVQGAYRVRFGGPADEIRADLTLGVRPRERWLVMAQSFNTISAGGGDRDLADPSEHKLQLSAVYDLTKRLSLQVGGVATVAGREALRERGLVTAVWYRF